MWTYVWRGSVDVDVCEITQLSINEPELERAIVGGVSRNFDFERVIVMNFYKPL